ADAPRRGPLARAVDRAGIERRVRDRRVEVWQLIEEPDGEVRHDDGDVHEREAARREPVGERKHGATVAESRPSDIRDLAEPLREPRTPAAEVRSFRTRS